jgi:hypothetical protein
MGMEIYRRYANFVRNIVHYLKIRNMAAVRRFEVTCNGFNLDVNCLSAKSFPHIDDYDDGGDDDGDDDNDNDNDDDNDDDDDDDGDNSNNYNL